MIDSSIMYILLFISLYFEVFMLVSFLYRSQKTGVNAVPNTYEPMVAVVVPCWNEGKTLGVTVESLIALDYPAEKFEIIIVDDGSRDNTLAIAKRYESAPGSTGPRVTVLHKENGGKHSAMNLALEHTQAELIGCLDADSVVAPGALTAIVQVFQNPQVAAATPAIHTKKSENLLQHMQEAEYRLGLFVRFTLASMGSMYITPGPFSFFRTAVVRASGGWRHGYSTEDLEMAMRLQSQGYQIANVPGAQVFTGTPRTLRALFRQRVRWSYGFLRNGVDYRHMFGNKKYGNLGIIILPTALLSIGIAVYFFLHLIYSVAQDIAHSLLRYEIIGFNGFHPSFNAFYINTSALIFIVLVAVAMVIWLISVGSFIGTGKHRPPAGTALFVLFYSILAPLWLGTAAVRAAFRTGVKWR